MLVLMYTVLVISYILLFIWGIFLFRSELQFNKKFRFDETMYIFFVIFALLYDNVIILFGSKIGEGNVLETLSSVRFFFHAIFTPTLILFIWKICERLNLQVATTNLSKIIAYIFTIILIVYELYSSVIPLQLQVSYEHTILTYKSIENKTPWMIIVVMVTLSIIAIIFVHKFRFYILFAGITLVVIGFLFVTLLGEPIMNIFELFLLISLLLTKRFQIHYCRKIIPFRQRKIKLV